MCHARSAWWLETKSYARRIAPPPPCFTRQPRKKKHSLHFCFGGGEISFEKGKGVFLSGFCPPSIRAVWRGETQMPEEIFCAHFSRTKKCRHYFVIEYEWTITFFPTPLALLIVSCVPALSLT